MPPLIRPPQPPPLPDRLPLEEQVNDFLNRVSDFLEQLPTTRVAKQVEERLPVIESVEFPTPLGKIKTPRIEFPSFVPPRLDERAKEVVKAAVGDDLADLAPRVLTTVAGWVPGIGPILQGIVQAVAGPIADAVEDTYMAKLRDTMTDEEWRYFREMDKVSPSTTIAALRTWVKFRR